MSSSSRRPPRLQGLAEPGRPAAERSRADEWRALVAGVLGVCALLYLLPQLSLLADTRGYQAAPATLTGVQRQISPASFSGHPKKFRLWTERRESIVYRYTANGQSYEGADTVSDLPRGPLTIWYDPAEPGRSVALRPRALPVVIELVPALALLLYGFVGLRRGARQRRGRFGP
ncbi:MAG: hypothetical protein QOJ16_934 [Acidobacteriota bacterium]|jgi:hypothetical protein|nr:hypothetical protein [Acidobacteriota bacterium]